MSSMISSFLRRAVLTLPLLCVTFSHAAYNPSIVAADARWVVHADFDALRKSAIGRELVDAVQKAQSQATGGTIGIAVPKVLAALGSITAYGTNLAANPNAVDGALIAQGTDDLRKIAESILLQGTIAEPKAFSEAADFPFPAYLVRDPDAPQSTQAQVFVAFPPEPIILVSKSKAQLLKARDVFRGSSPSLATNSAPALTQLAANAENAYLFAATIVPAESVFPPNSPQTRTLQLASSGALALGELGTHTFAKAELIASSDANAERLSKIIQGMTAVLSFAESNDRQLGEFLNATAVTREKNTVKLNLTYPSARLVQMAQNLRQQMEARPQNANRPPPPIAQGRTVAEWTAADIPTPEGTDAGVLLWRTVENVKLLNGSTISLGRHLNGGRNVRFDRLEIIPQDQPGQPLTFRSEYMRNQRGTMFQVQFPGADGNYTLKVAYVNDPEGKAKFAVSVSDPKPAPAKPAAPAANPR